MDEDMEMNKNLDRHENDVLNKKTNKREYMFKILNGPMEINDFVERCLRCGRQYHVIEHARGIASYRAQDPDRDQARARYREHVSKYNTTNERRRVPKKRNLNMRTDCSKTAIDILDKSTQNVTDVEKYRNMNSTMGAFAGYVLNGNTRKSANVIRGGCVGKHLPILHQC